MKVGYLNCSNSPTNIGWFKDSRKNFKDFRKFNDPQFSFSIAGDSPSKKKPKLEDEDKEKLERNSSNLDAILDDVIKGGVDAEGNIQS